MDEKKCVPSRRVVLERRAPGARARWRRRATETAIRRRARSTTATLDDDAEARRTRRRARGMGDKIHEAGSSRPSSWTATDARTRT